MNETDARDSETDVLVLGPGTTGHAVDVMDVNPVAGHPTFDEMLARYKDEIYRYAAHLTPNRDAADNLYQRTLLAAYRGFDQLDSAANHRIWLYTLATNTFLNDQRKRGRGASSAKEQADTLPDAPEDDGDRLDGHDLLLAVEAFVAELPSKQRVALVQRKFHDLTYAEIAASLRCSETAARGNVYKTLRALRDRCGDPL